MPSFIPGETFSLLEHRFQEKSNFYLKSTADFWSTGLSGKKSWCCQISTQRSENLAFYLKKDGLHDALGFGRIGELHCAASPQIGRISRAMTLI